jgi:hypothetical protein
MDLETFVDAYSDQLEIGWSGFTGVLRAEKSKRPDDVPVEYVMDRFSIKLKYRGQPYRSVILELVPAEIDSTEASVERLGTDIATIFDEIGLPQPAPVRVISAEHQIVQKLHACTGEAAGGRAHDLIDIQILAAIEDIDHAEIGRIGRQLFAYRQRHVWPCVSGRSVERIIWHPFMRVRWPFGGPSRREATAGHRLDWSRTMQAEGRSPALARPLRG